jgi:hypothetical protein
MLRAFYNFVGNRRHDERRAQSILLRANGCVAYLRVNVRGNNVAPITKNHVIYVTKAAGHQWPKKNRRDREQKYCAQTWT